MRLCQCLLLSLLLLGVVSAATAEVLRAEGQSVITGDLETARQNAINDALRRAALQAGGQVQSHTQVSNGRVVRDDMHLQASARVDNVRVLHESHKGGVYHVLVEAGVNSAPASCNARGYHKSVLFTGFNRERPQSATVGGLHNVDSTLPEELARRLYPAHDTLVQTQTRLQLASNARFLDDYYQQAHSLQQAASRHHTQYVVTGTVLDMSMHDTDAYYRQNSITRAGHKLVSGVTGMAGRHDGDIRNRHFALRVVLHDGLSGEALFDKTYTTDGVWNARYRENTGFASPRFWNTHYGERVDDLLETVVAELGEKLDCQPFMAEVRVDRKDTGAYVMAGANHGIKVGDSLKVMAHSRAPFTHLGRHSSAYPLAEAPARLETSEAQMVVTQVYPTYSVGTFTAPLAPHYRYLAVAQ